MSVERARAGICRGCGRELVQVYVGEGATGFVARTYHPWNALPVGESCPDLIPLDCGCPKVCYSSNVPAENFNEGEVA